MQLTPEHIARLNDLDQQLGWVKAWAEGVQAEIRALRDGVPVASVDDDVAAADSPTRVLKALEREFGKDRRTILGWVERLVKVYQLERKYGADWGKNTQLFKDLAKRDANGQTALARGLASLDKPAAGA